MHQPVATEADHGRPRPCPRSTGGDLPASVRRHAAAVRTGWAMGRALGPRRCCRRLRSWWQGILSKHCSHVSFRPPGPESTWHVGTALSALGRGHPCHHGSEPRRADAFAGAVRAANVLDKHVYSPWTEGRLDAMLTWFGNRHADHHRWRDRRLRPCHGCSAPSTVASEPVLVTHALCSSADQAHYALMELYRSRFSEQAEAVMMQEVLENWR
jgi:hypothetical protein